MRRKCLACGRRPAVTLPKSPPVCDACLRRSGREPIRTGDRVLCDPELGGMRLSEPSNASLTRDS